MDSVYFLLALAIILALFWMVKQRRIAAIRHVLNRKRNSGKDKVMEELARQFIGKECIIYTVTSTDSSIQGTVKDVTDGGIVLEKDGNVEAVNLEYVTRIREYPAMPKERGRRSSSDKSCRTLADGTGYAGQGSIVKPSRRRPWARR